MYIPKHFAVSDKEEIDRFIDQNSFGVMVSQQAGDTIASHVPVYRSSATQLQIHIAKANPQWQELDGQRVLIVLQGLHDYISPTWYERPGGVPTWNYQAVHIYGTAKCFSDTAKLDALVKALSHRYESARPNPWQPDYNPNMLTAIIGIEIEIDDIQCKFKLSQNRPVTDIENVSSELAEAGNPALAAAMRSQIKKS